jgi:hypothetical protein
MKVTCSNGLAWLLGALAVISFVPKAFGGTVVDVKTVYFDEKRQDEGATIYFDTNRVRFDAIEGGERLSLVFHVNEKGEPVCWVIDQEKKTYVELNEKIVGQIETQAERARQMFEEQLRNAPPDQREQIKRTMDAQLKAAGWNKIAVNFKKIASGVKLKTWRCTQYESYVDGTKYEDVWAAAATDVGLAEADLRTLRGMGDLFSGISSQTNAFFQVGRNVDQGGFEGFPVVVVQYRDGKKFEKSEVKAVRKENLDKNVFELPQGVQERKLAE